MEHGFIYLIAIIDWLRCPPMSRQKIGKIKVDLSYNEEENLLIFNPPSVHYFLFIKIILNYR
jgi:hypothetical protein